MSPIDIVPMAPSPCDERFEDTLTVPNGLGYRNIGYASGTQRSMDGGVKLTTYFKPVSYTVMHTFNVYFHCTCTCTYYTLKLF